MTPDLKRRPDRREGRQRAPQGAGRRKAASSVRWTVLEIRAWRRGRGPARRVHQHHRRHHYRRGQQGLGFGEAARTYTLLTVGDGLVTQVPALIVSTAAGLLVSKAGVSGAADKALMKQLSGYPRGARHVGRRDAGAGAAAGHSDDPFPLAGRRCGGAGVIGAQTQSRGTEAEAIAAAAPSAARGRECRGGRADCNALKIDDLKIELGYALLPLVNGPDGTDRLTEQIKALRRSLAVEMGFVMPAVRILDNVQLEANTYVIKIRR